MSQPLRTAFVGCGGIAAHYLSVYRDLPWVQMTACVDSVAERAQQAAAFLSQNQSGNPAPRVAKELASALQDDVDVIVINTPNHLHREQTLAALAAGKHVLLQKPVAATLADAEAIDAAARAAAACGVTSGLYLSYFDQPLMHDLRAMIRAGWFGAVVHLAARLMHRGGLLIAAEVQRGQANWRASLAQTGGGCFIQLAVHYIHLFRWMLDARITRVMAMTNNLHCPGIAGEDLACALLEFENGALATLEMAWNTAGEQLAVHGTRGTAEYVGNEMLLLDSAAGAFSGHVVQYAGQGGQTTPGAPGASATRQSLTITAPSLGDVQNPFNQQRRFLEAVRDGAQPFVSIAAGVDDLRVVSAIYESARTGCAVNL